MCTYMSDSVCVYVFECEGCLRSPMLCALKRKWKKKIWERTKLQEFEETKEENLKIGKTATYTEYRTPTTDHYIHVFLYKNSQFTYAVVETPWKTKIAKWNEIKTENFIYNFLAVFVFGIEFLWARFPFLYFIFIFLSFIRCFFRFNISLYSSALRFNDLVWEWNVVANDDLNSVMIFLVSVERAKSKERCETHIERQCSSFIVIEYFLQTTENLLSFLNHVWSMKGLHSFQWPNSHHTLGHLILHGFHRNITKLRPITANNIIFLNNFFLLGCCCHLPFICINILYSPRACLKNLFHRNWRYVQRFTCSPQFHFIFQLKEGGFTFYTFYICCAFAHGLWFMVANKLHSCIIHLRSSIYFASNLFYSGAGIGIDTIGQLKSTFNWIEIRLWNSTFNIFPLFLLVFPWSNLVASLVPLLRMLMMMINAQSTKRNICNFTRRSLV